MNTPHAAPPLTVITPGRMVDGISVFDRTDYNQWFEEAYNTSTEPWEYSHRAAELFRHQYSVQQIRRHKPTPLNLLELGCSKGLMTELLMPFTSTIHAADISLTAVKACKQRCDAKGLAYACRMNYYVATTPGLPFDAESFDVVTICDGLAGWWLPDDQKILALRDTYRVLKSGGIAILTDCLMPEQNKGESIEAYEALIRSGPLSVIEISYLYDKPWYKLESLMKKLRLDRQLSGLLSSISLAKMLNSIGRLIGRKASRHIIMILRKD